ncbi:hypothetical protein V7056_08045 [Bacillus sp. JJ664]
MNFLNKFYAVILSAIMISGIWGWFSSTPEKERVYECCYTGVFEGFVISLPITFTCYMIFGIGVAYIIDELTKVFHIKKFIYVFQFIMFTIAGVVVAMIFAIMESIGLTMFYALFSVPASLLYFHVLFFIKLLRNLVSTKRKRQP